MIPGLHGSFMFPLVNDGESFQHTSCLTVTMAMLLCLTCDLPATRKASIGCSKCLKQFAFGKKKTRATLTGYFVIYKKRII